jgi:hypothetical protein
LQAATHLLNCPHQDKFAITSSEAQELLAWFKVNKNSGKKSKKKTVNIFELWAANYKKSNQKAHQTRFDTKQRWVNVILTLVAAASIVFTLWLNEACWVQPVLWFVIHPAHRWRNWEYLTVTPALTTRSQVN